MGDIKMERDRVPTKVCNIFHSSRQMAMVKDKTDPRESPTVPTLATRPLAHSQKRDCYLQNPRATHGPHHALFFRPLLTHPWNHPFHSKKNF
ncbi:uncharacterized protein LOC26536248 [Drosophila yakuba]|nr:uncharacterized protein LOC26536248 [Drosophila yakuba]